VQTLKVMMAEIAEGGTLCIPGISAKLNSQGEVTDSATVKALQSLLDTIDNSTDST
jgi:chromate reductase, NAD(P)H dehydrogenase (quinone)